MKVSAGLLMYRRGERGLEVLLVHPGGPFFAQKDEGFWGIPKGLIDDGEPGLEAARREFLEETSIVPETDAYLELGEVRQRSGKRVHAWAFEGDCDAEAVVSNTFELEWPPKSGRTCEFPEIDRATWFDLGSARVKINPAQAAFLDRLAELLAETT